MDKKSDKNLIPAGTLRIKTSDLDIYEKTKTGWKKSKTKLPDAMQVIKLFKAHKNLKSLIDKKNPEFLKGQLYHNETRGARINILPDGKILDKAFSLFGKNLVIHDESSNEHWNVLYQNKGGTYSYVYTLRKKKQASRKKYKSVEEFAKIYQRLNQNVLKALKNRNDFMALPMFTILKTLMRVGNEIYYKAHNHKGLTTLKKEDISIKENHVTFDYLAKNAVPLTITEEFPSIYIKRLKELLKKTKPRSFVFINPSTMHALKDTDFKKAFKQYCGKEFYPHIVRSYYATKLSREFIKTHKKISKNQMNEFFLQIADKLGHKRFVKKKNEWEDNFNVTINHYIEPDLVERIKKLVK